MSHDPEAIRRPTKRPRASKMVHIDQDCSNCPGSFSNNSSQSISPENYSLSSLKTEISKFSDGCIDKNHVLQYLQYIHLTLLERYRNDLSNALSQIEREHLTSRTEQISKAKVVDYDLPIKSRFGYHNQIDSNNTRPSVTISPSALHGSSSSANLSSISRSHSTISSSASTTSISFPQRAPSSPGSLRDKTRSTFSEPNSISPQIGNDSLSDKNSTITNTSANQFEAKNDEDAIFGNQDSFFRSNTDPTNGMCSISFASSSASIPSSSAAAIPRSMSASHFSRNSATDGQGEKDSSSNNSPSKSSASSTKSMTALTIWNNVNKFFVVTPTVEQFQQRLQPSEPPDIKLPLGPHYSIGINQRLKQKFKNGNVQLRIPPEVIAESPEGVTSIIFHRLLAAFVTLDVNDLAYLKSKKDQYEENQDEENFEEEQNAFRGSNSLPPSEFSNEIENSNEIEKPIKISNFRSTQNLGGYTNVNDNFGGQQKIIDARSFSYSKADINSRYQNLNYISDFPNAEQYPVNVAGTSIYSMCPFEQKLMLEVQSLNLVPEPSGLKMTDNEVMNDIIQKSKELKQVADETNRMKMDLLETLKNKEKELLERKEKSKKWGSVSFKVEQGQKKDLKRPKKRDKLI